MKEMKAQLKSVWLTLTLLCAAFPSFGHERSVQVVSPAPAAGSKLGQARSQNELDDYNKLRSEADPATRQTLIDHFAVAYPDSSLLAFVYQDAVYLGRESNNIERMEEYGEKSLKLWPDNYTLMTDLACAYVQRDRVDEAELLATRALDLIAVAERPAGKTESQWSSAKKVLVANNETTLGFVHLRRANDSLTPGIRTSEAETAIQSLRRSLENRPIDDFTFYGLGFAYAVRDDYGNAESYLARAVAVNGIVAASARSLLEEIYRSRHDQTLLGLEQVIGRARVDLGLAQK
jgi:tetratricopeptide (TPR) repeat protein